MTNEEAEKYADNMTYRDAINNLMKARSIPYRKATFIKVNELLKALEQEKSSDLISRQAVLDTIHLFFTEEIDKIPTKKTEDGEVLIMCKAQPLFAMNKTLCKRIKALPSVTAEPKTGHCKDCKWWKDSDGAYRRGIGAESQCPMNRIEVFEGNGYCYMFEPQESEVTDADSN